MEIYEKLWTRLKSNHFLPMATNQSAIENKLPFGMQRTLPELKNDNESVIRESANTTIEGVKLLKASNFCLNIKDPLIYNEHEEQKNNLHEHLQDHLKHYKQPQQQRYKPVYKFKFVGNPIITATSKSIVDEAALKLEPLTILFFNKEGECNSTNLTSNLNGTISNDKSNLASIFKNGSTWLINLSDLLNSPSISVHLPQIQNNKLRNLKYCEFIDEEWKEFRGFGDEIEFVSLTRNLNHYCITVSRRCKPDSKLKMNLFIIDGKTGKIKFSTISLNRNLFLESIYHKKIEIDHGDFVILIKATDLDLIINILKDGINDFEINSDYEDILMKKISKSRGIESLIVSRFQKLNEFDESFMKGQQIFQPKDQSEDQTCTMTTSIATSGIIYSSHLDTKLGLIVNKPIPGSFGCTTRHSVIYRRGYFCALHHDASKINRFPDTINYIIRKLTNASNLGMRLEQDCDESPLKRISDVQYFAYFLKFKGSFILALGGGAKCIKLSKDLNLIEIYENSTLIQLENVKRFDQFLLCSPQFPPSSQIHSIQAPTIQEWIMKLFHIQPLEVQNFKVSFCHFVIE